MAPIVMAGAIVITYKHYMFNQIYPSNPGINTAFPDIVLVSLDSNENSFISDVADLPQTNLV